MQTSGVDGPMTWKGADVLIIDDPVENDADADSATYRDHAREWFGSMAYTGLEPGGSILLVMTHWQAIPMAYELIASMISSAWLAISDR